MYMKILYSGFRDKNHSSAGGYDKIVNFPESSYISDQDVPFGYIPVGKKGKSINLLFLDIYTRIIRYRFDVVHFFYGDNILFPYMKSRKHKIVATVHLDIEKHKRMQKIFIKSLRNIDGVIVLSSEQEKSFKEKYNINATFIPHGFSKPIFHECDISMFSYLKSENINIFFSGTNYRDFEILFKSIDYTNKNHLNIFFHVVGQKDFYIINRIKEYKNAYCYSRLSDDEYFTLLSNCDYNFLPLLFSTANNALLEAQFLGVKSILPNISGINDYAAPYPINIFYNNLDDLEKIWGFIHKNSRSVALMEYANQFLWNNIYHRLELFYRNL